jgi:hypothetical protein
MGLFDRLFGRRVEARPILLRIAGRADETPTTVEIEARWAPSGRRMVRSVWTAQGLCILPWVAGQVSVDLVLRAPGRHASLTLSAQENAQGHALEIEMLAPVAAE